MTPTDHLTLTQVRAYVRGALHPSTLLTIDDHLETCPACRGALAREADASFGAEAFGRALAVPDARPESPHLTFDHLRGAVEGTLGAVDDEWLHAHVGLCVMCAEELRDLERFSGFVAVAAPASMPTTVATSEGPRLAPAHAAVPLPTPPIASARRPTLPRIRETRGDEPPPSFGVTPVVRMPWWLGAAAAVSTLALLQMWAC